MNLSPPPSKIRQFNDAWIRWIYSLYDYTKSGISRDLINVKGYGALGDGVTDDYAAIQAAFDAAALAGLHVYFPPGHYICSKKITSTGYPVSVSGASVVASLVVFTTTDGGFDINVDAQGAGVPPDRVAISDITIETRAAVTTPALDIAWSAYQPNAQGQLTLDRVHITRKADGTGSFTDGVKLTNCIVASLNRVWILGDDARVSAIGVNLIDCVAISLVHCFVNRYAKGLRAIVSGATQTEGVTLTDCLIYDVYDGVDIDTAIAVTINAGTHININGASAGYAVRFDTVNQAFIDSSLLYFGGASGDAANQDGVQLISCTGVHISNSMILGLVTAQCRGGVVMSGSCGHNEIMGNTISNCTNGIWFSAAGDSLNTAIGNKIFNTTTPVVDVGTLNTVALNTDDLGAVHGALAWGAAYGHLAVGEISANANWGCYIRGHSGTTADVALVDSADVACLTVKSGSARAKSYTVATLPSAAGDGGFIYVSNEAGGSTLAFSDGTNWRRVQDRAIVS